MEFNSLSELRRWARESRGAKAARVFRTEYQRRVRHEKGRRRGEREK